MSQAFDGATLGERLLQPTRIYVKPLLDLAAKINIHALAHITGGGLLETLPRVMPANTCAQIDAASWQGTYANADGAESDGVEVGISAIPYPNWRFGLNYTYTDSHRFIAADNANTRMVQVPYNKFNLNATWLCKGASVSVDGYWVDGTRLRWNLTDKLDSYFKLDLTARVPITAKVELGLRVRNLFDEDYNESYGMKETGITAYGGLTLRY